MINKIKLLSLLGFIGLWSATANAQTVVCNEDFSYQLESISETSFSLVLNETFTSAYKFQLYTVSSKTELLSEKQVQGSNEKVIYDDLLKNEIYLIQVTAVSGECRFTIGGIEGIKFVND